MWAAKKSCWSISSSEAVRRQPEALQSRRLNCASANGFTRRMGSYLNPPQRNSRRVQLAVSGPEYPPHPLPNIRIQSFTLPAPLASACDKCAGRLPLLLTDETGVTNPAHIHLRLVALARNSMVDKVRPQSAWLAFSQRTELIPSLQATWLPATHRVLVNGGPGRYVTAENDIRTTDLPIASTITVAGQVPQYSGSDRPGQVLS